MTCPGNAAFWFQFSWLFQIRTPSRTGAQELMRKPRSLAANNVALLAPLRSVHFSVCSAQFLLAKPWVWYVWARVCHCKPRQHSAICHSTRNCGASWMRASWKGRPARDRHTQGRTRGTDRMGFPAAIRSPGGVTAATAYHGSVSGCSVPATAREMPLLLLPVSILSWLVCGPEK